MAEHDVTIRFAGPGYQARCSCGWQGVIRASDHAIRRAKQECYDHLTLADRKHKRVPVTESSDD